MATAQVLLSPSEVEEAAPEVGVAPAQPTELDVLCEAANVLDRTGWIQDYQHSRAGYCAVGAIQRASERLGLSREWRSSSDYLASIEWAAIVRLLRVVNQFDRREAITGSTRKWGCVESWNDQPGQTAANVKKLLRMAGECG